MRRTLGGALALGLITACGAAWGDVYTYDLLGRVKTHLAADGKLTTYNYDAAGNRTSVVTVSSGGNRPPVAVDDAYGLNEGTPSLSFDPRGNDSDPDGQAISVIGVTNAQFGQVSRSGNTITYTPSLGSRRFSTRDTFAYAIQDSAGLQASATVTITLVNLPPVAVTDNISVPRNLGANTPFVFDPRANDSDPGGDSFIIVAASAPAHGVANAQPTSITYIPTVNYVGADSFTYTIRDAEGAQAIGTVNVSVAAPPNTGPTAQPDFFTIDPPITLPQDFDVLQNDSDPDLDTLTITGVSTPQNGTVQIIGGQTLRYTASGSGQGDSFTYTITDGNGHTATGTVTVTFNLG